MVLPIHLTIYMVLHVCQAQITVDVLARMRLEAAMDTLAPTLGLVVVWVVTVAPAVATTLGRSLDGSLDAAVQRRASVWRAHKR